MRYVALVRGINVGGANKIDMRELKHAFEAAGMDDVRTYINSGNVLFSSALADEAELAHALEDAIRERFSIDTRVLVRDSEQMRLLVEAIPADWANNESMKCDVVFVGSDVDPASVAETIGPRPGIEHVAYAPGALIWRVDRKDATRNRLTRIVGTPLYKQVTVRNCNTVRKLLHLMQTDL